MPPRGLVNAKPVNLNLHLVRGCFVIVVLSSLDGFSLAGLHQTAGKKVLLALLNCSLHSFFLSEVQFQYGICLLADNMILWFPSTSMLIYTDPLDAEKADNS